MKLIKMVILLSLIFFIPQCKEDGEVVENGSVNTAAIVFNSYRDGNDEIYSMNIDGSNPINLTKHAAADYYPLWSPDGKKLGFISNRSGRRALWTMNSDGTNPLQVTTVRYDISGFSWSPDGTKFVFEAFIDTTYPDPDTLGTAIFTIDANGSNLTQLTHNSAFDKGAVWSPNGAQIAFSSFRDHQNQIYLMNTNGTNQVNLSSDMSSNDANPCWSPDGSTIVYQSYVTGSNNQEISSIQSTGLGKITLSNTSPPIQESAPVISPGGGKIIYTRYVYPVYSDWIMNSNGTSQTKLGDNCYPPFRWSADGMKVVFAVLDSSESYHYHIAIADVDSAIVRRLTDSTFIDTNPDLRPN